MKGLFSSLNFFALLDVCTHLPASYCIFTVRKPFPHWSIARGLPTLTWIHNFRIRLLVGCDGLEAHACRFRYRSCSSSRASTNGATCRLCRLEVEDALHFLARCPALDSCGRSLLNTIPSSPFNMLRIWVTDPTRFANLILGVEWVEYSNRYVLKLNVADALAWNETCTDTKFQVYWKHGY